VQASLIRRFRASYKSVQVSISFWYSTLQSKLITTQKAHFNSIGIGKVTVRFEKAMSRSNNDDDDKRTRTARKRVVGGQKKTQTGIEIGGIRRPARDSAGIYQSLNRVTTAEKDVATNVLALTINSTPRSRSGLNLSGSG
jgi:hypothetical protein